MMTRPPLDEARRRLKILLLREALSSDAYFIDVYEFPEDFTVVDVHNNRFKVSIEPESGVSG